jgi:pyruvate dehydrogenase E1 component alpha subunit
MRTKHDPIEGARHRLESLGITELEFKAIDDEVKSIVADAAEFAQSSPEPDAKELWTDVLVEV